MTMARAWSRKGAARLSRPGLHPVTALAGGLEGWRRAGFELFQDVNSYSKAFGELVESRRHTPYVAAPDAKALIESEPNLVVLDARRFEEYQTMSIPRGVSASPARSWCLRAREIAPDPSTTIIVNCAGRTRSIIGAQSLINAGLPNKVMALRNGTIGWTLEGQALEHGKAGRFPEVGRRSRGRGPRRGPRRLLPRRRPPTSNTRTLDALRARRPGAPSTASTSARPRNTPPATSPASAARPAASLCRRPTSLPPSAARASSWPMTAAYAPT